MSEAGVNPSPFSRPNAGSLVDQVMTFFNGVELPSRVQVEEMVDGFLKLPNVKYLADQREWIIDEVLRRTDVSIDAAEVLDNNEAHEPWLEDVDQSDWRLWRRLRAHLQYEEGIPPQVIGELDSSTTKTLARLESPNRDGQWDRRGMVVGHVQSGKTTHYTTLAAKALDAGYRIVVVLAGMHNNLRSQTHGRIDRDLTGRNSRATRPGLDQWAHIGVQELQRKRGWDGPTFAIQTSTTADENGDFRAKQAHSVYLQVGEGTRLVMVVKKNASVLKKLRDWFRGLLSQHGANPGQLIPHPVLFIDDEADQASMNTKDPDEDPSTINRLIRELLTSFRRVGFVAYTATPFANVFAAPDTSEAERQRFGKDLFPDSFIVSLRAPTNYIGPAQVFGSPGDDPEGLAAREPLPMHVEVADGDAWIPPRHKKDYDVGPPPGSLLEAIRLFVLVCAARCCRGDTKAHSSMLIHVTRFVNVQAQVAGQVREELASLRSLVRNGGGLTRAKLEADLRGLWEREIAAKHPAFVGVLGKMVTDLPAWEDVWRQVAAAAERIEVMEINGESTDALAYDNHKDNGFWVIAIGGDRLSRGLTLEGLSISYFLRTSNMFDTLMQMGRWFGYRPGYSDLCRIYTTRELVAAFRQIALATEELRRDFDRMVVTGQEPRDFGLRVRTPSDGLLITAANKLRRGEEIQVRFAGEIVQALRVPKDGPKAAANRRALEELIGKLGTPVRQVRGKSVPWYVWHGVDASNVLEFLEDYHASRTQAFVNGAERLREYVRGQIETADELTEWTVCLMSLSEGEQARIQARIADLDVGLVKRGPSTADCPAGEVDMKQVAGRREEAADLSDKEFTDSGEGKDRETIREVRPSSRGLLLLYPIRQENRSANDYVLSAVVSLPTSDRARTLAYTVNEVWQQQELGFLKDDEDELQ